MATNPVNGLIMSAVNANASSNSAAFDVSNIYTAVVIIVVSGGTAPTGTFKIQASCDNSSWADVASATAAITDNGVSIIPLASVAYPWIRLVYTRASGTGTINARISGKG